MKKKEVKASIRIECSRCAYEWNYGGKLGKAVYPEYCSCPRCRKPIRIPKVLK